MSTMWIGQVACYIYLMRLNLLQELAHNLNILFRHRQFFNLTRLVERQVKEVNMV